MSITVLAAIYLIVGVVGFVFHGREILAHHMLRSEDLLVELTEAIAFIAGVFLLRGRNWARWLAVAWMVFHVVLSVFGPISALLLHAVFCVAIAWILFRADAAHYFRAGEIDAR